MCTHKLKCKIPMTELKVSLDLHCNSNVRLDFARQASTSKTGFVGFKITFCEPIAVICKSSDHNLMVTVL